MAGHDMRETPVPSVSIVVPCRNERAWIERFLDAALRQQDVEGGFEIIVADGRSDDGTRQLLDERARSEDRLIVIDNPAGIVSTGLNAAIRRARGEIILRMDVHAEFAPDYVRECVKALVDSGAQNVGGPALTRAENRFQRANAVAYQSPFSVGGARFHDPGFEGYVDTVVYGCWRKTDLIELGLFDEDLVRNQDDELNLRLCRRGGRLYQTPRIRSWYFPRSDMRSLFRQYFQYGYWKVRVIRKHRLPASPRHLVPIFALLIGTALFAIGFWWRPAWLMLAMTVGAYACASLVASWVAANRAGDLHLVLLLPGIFLTYHAAYGLGFAAAMLDQLAGRNRPSSGATRLSR